MLYKGIPPYICQYECWCSCVLGFRQHGRRQQPQDGTPVATLVTLMRDPMTSLTLAHRRCTTTTTTTSAIRRGLQGELGVAQTEPGTRASTLSDDASHAPAQRTPHSVQCTVHTTQRTPHTTHHTPHITHITPHSAQHSTAQHTVHGRTAQRTATAVVSPPEGHHGV